LLVALRSHLGTPTVEEEVSIWADLLSQTPLIAIILALGITVIHLFRSKERLQAKYTEDLDRLQAKYAEDLVKATGALHELTAEYLKQAFANSAAWQERIQALDTTFKKHVEDAQAADRRFEEKLDGIREEVVAHEVRVREYVTAYVDRAVEKTERNLERLR